MLLTAHLVDSEEPRYSITGADIPVTLLPAGAQIEIGILLP
jgi:hypothetical protein